MNVFGKFRERVALIWIVYLVFKQGKTLLGQVVLKQYLFKH